MYWINYSARVRVTMPVSLVGYGYVTLALTDTGFVTVAVTKL